MAPYSFSLSTRINLSSGLSIPQIHLGVYLMSNREASKAVNWALQAGYRAIDSKYFLKGLSAIPRLSFTSG